MAGKLNSLSGRMVLVVLLTHTVLLPALFYAVLAVVNNSQKQTFIDDSRFYTRVFADLFESDKPATDAHALRLLDTAILSGRGVFATILVNDSILASSLMNENEGGLFREDFTFGEHGDDVYYLSIPVTIQGSVGVLRLGFDEVPTLLNIADIERSVLMILLAYLVISLLLVMILSTLLVAPIQRLRDVSREIASGDYSRKLHDKTRLFEIQELVSDLETMRSNLVGANLRLREVIKEREVAEAEQRSLEARLRHGHRLESIGTLAGGIAHEFNNALAPIVLYTDLALEDLPADSAVRAKLVRVMELALRAKGLSQQILAFGSRSGEADEADGAAIDIAPVIEESLSLVRVLIPATVDIQADIKHGLGLVLCDAVQIQQLVLNLCNNAFRSLSRGGGRIQVSVVSDVVDAEFVAQHPRLSEGRHVILTVSDTGVGMDASTVERIFEPFFTTQEVGQGTGLGLSIVHGIVVRHDGEITVSSTPGQGTVIRIYFPLADN
jgi:signal transduction histidine kinase